MMEIKRGHYGQRTQEKLHPTQVSKEKAAQGKMAKFKLDQKKALSYFPHNLWGLWQGHHQMSLGYSNSLCP